MAIRKALRLLIILAPFQVIFNNFLNDTTAKGCGGGETSLNNVITAGNNDAEGRNIRNMGCKKLGLPQPMDKIPLSPKSYEFDASGSTTNFFIATADPPQNIYNYNVQQTPPIQIAFPNEPRLLARWNGQSGKVQVRNNGNIWNRIKKEVSSPEDGIFIDVGGWIGDTSIPSAAHGLDTYVFEPVRNNANMIHIGMWANDCHVSEHLTIVNAMVGDRDSTNETIYVTARADNSAATKSAATRHVGDGPNNFIQPVDMITLDTFFPTGTKVQNLKIDVQGNELYVLKGARRLLTENKDRLHLRLEYQEDLIQAAGLNPQDVLRYVKSLGYKEVKREGSDIDWRAE